MSEFKKIQEAVTKQFEVMSSGVDHLYTLNLEKNELWDIYLNSFPEGKNEIFRERREHDCCACRQFVNTFGDVVSIKDGKIVSIWDFELNDDTYDPSIKAMMKHIKSIPIKDVFINTEKDIGIKCNHEIAEDGKVTTWEHMSVTLPDRFVVSDDDSIATTKGKYRDIKNVFKRSLEELTPESINTVLELIAQNSLYKGEEWKAVLTEFLAYKTQFNKLEPNKQDVWLWSKATTINTSIGKLRNHSIGTLLINISEGMNLDLAVRKYETIVAPTNYKRPKPVYTKKMLDNAKAKLEKLGFLDSLQRRFAILEDISVNNVLFANRDVETKLQKDDVFAEMEKQVPINPKQFNKVEEVSIKDFVDKILPTTKSVEVFLDNKHSSNMVSLIAPFKADSKSMFKWNNNFSWAYTGNITDSDIKKNVKSAGGKVDGVLRFSIQWNDGSEHNRDDYDAHCIEPNGNEISFLRRHNFNTTGDLDIDIQTPRLNTPAVENITWSNKSKMQQGKYLFFVHNYAHRGGSDGFRAEIEHDGQQYKFDYPQALRQGEKITVAPVIFDGTNFTVNETLSSTTTSKELWNNSTNNFVPVSVLMYSPNYWDEQKGIGNKHYFFMLKDCINTETPNGFFNEYLNNELTEHRKVFEALGNKLKVEDASGQLSGLGFSSTQRNSIIVRVEGSTKRVLKINF